MTISGATLPIADNDNNEFRFYVYAWQYPDGQTFYVGKGQGRRARRPTAGRNKIFKHVVEKINRSGGEPRIVMWHTGLREKDAFCLEVAYIKLFGRRDIGTGVLVNLSDGGEGNGGIPTSEETRAKLSAAVLGRRHTAETIAKMSIAQKGRKRSPETCENIRLSKIGIKQTPEHRAKNSAANTGRKHKPETIAKMREAQMGKTHSEATRAILSAANLGKKLSPETRAKMSESHKNVSTEARARMRDAQIKLPPRNGFKGVSLHKSSGRWKAVITADGKQRRLGHFVDPKDAAIAYDRAAYSLWGEDCYLNFPSERQPLPLIAQQ